MSLPSGYYTVSMRISDSRSCHAKLGSLNMPALSSGRSTAEGARSWPVVIFIALNYNIPDPPPLYPWKDSQERMTLKMVVFFPYGNRCGLWSFGNLNAHDG